MADLSDYVLGWGRMFGGDVPGQRAGDGLDLLAVLAVLRGLETARPIVVADELYDIEIVPTEDMSVLGPLLSAVANDSWVSFAHGGLVDPERRYFELHLILRSEEPAAAAVIEATFSLGDQDVAADAVVTIVIADAKAPTIWRLARLDDIPSSLHHRIALAAVGYLTSLLGRPREQ